MRRRCRWLLARRRWHCTSTASTSGRRAAARRRARCPAACSVPARRPRRAPRCAPCSTHLRRSARVSTRARAEPPAAVPRLTAATARSSASRAALASLESSAALALLARGAAGAPRGCTRPTRAWQRNLGRTCASAAQRLSARRRMKDTAAATRRKLQSGTPEHGPGAARQQLRSTRRFWEGTSFVSGRTTVRDRSLGP